MADAITAWYIATVWMGDRDDLIGTRSIIRLPAIGPADYRVRVQQLWPDRWVIVGPISRSKVQG